MTPGPTNMATEMNTPRLTRSRPKKGQHVAIQSHEATRARKSIVQTNTVAASVRKLMKLAAHAVRTLIEAALLSKITFERR